MHYCIGDVHGCYDELMRMLQNIEIRDNHAGFILLGDLVDRGPKSSEMIDWAIGHISEAGKYQCIMGNHEDLILQWYDFKYLPWYQSKKDTDEILPRSKFEFSQIAQRRGWITPDSLKPVISKIRSLPLQKKLAVTDLFGRKKEYIIVHASYDETFGNGILQKKANLRLRRFNGNINPAYTVIFGHTPTGDTNFLQKTKLYDSAGRIAYLPGAINLDGGCCFGTRDGYQGHLCGLCLENGEEYYEQLTPASIHSRSTP